MALPSFAFWPESVPWEADGSSYTEKPQGLKATFQPEAGVPIERPRVTLLAEEISYTSRPMTSEQFDALRDFWRITLKQGSLNMLRYHPRYSDGTIIVARFVEPPMISSSRGFDLLGVGIRLLKMPSAYD
jgi:hypothetical protein